jgi:bifunctional non-homologous end joining protein LigD
MTASARRLAEATRTPQRDRRIVPATDEPIMVGDIVVPRTGDTTLHVDGRELRVTNLDRSLYPAAPFTKADSIAYHLAVAHLLLPVLRERPLTVGRFPGGVDARGFAQSEIPGRPSWVRAIPLVLVKGPTKEFTLVDERATLVWLVQMGVIELHTFLGRAGDLEHPTDIVFDLDPTAPAGLLEAADVALFLRERLVAEGFAPRVKTSGSIGMHVLAPARPGATYDETRALASRLAKELTVAHPELVTDRMERSARAGRVLLDARQNAQRLTTVVAYSLRSTPTPNVSTPLTWAEVERACGRRSRSDLVFSAHDVARERATPLAGW